MVKNGIHWDVPWSILAILKECVPLSTTSIASFNVSSLHRPRIVIECIQFNYVDDLLFYGLRMGERFSLLIIGFIAYKSNMSFCLLLKRIVKFMIVYLFMVLAFSNLVECIIASPRVCLFLPYKLQPKNSESVIHLIFLL
jgi:hypothetical protein